MRRPSASAWQDTGATPARALNVEGLRHVVLPFIFYRVSNPYVSKEERQETWIKYRYVLMLMTKWIPCTYLTEHSITTSAYVLYRSKS